MLRTRAFILVLVLWVLLALTIAVSALAAWVSRTTDQAVLLADERRGQVDIADTLQTLEFLLATRPSRVDGLYLGPKPKLLVRQWRRNPFGTHRNERHPADLPLNDTWFSGLGGARVQLQDEAGLIALQALKFGHMRGLVGQVGASRLARDQLIRQLREYILTPAQSLPGRRLAAEYDAAGLPRPPGRYLIAPMEALRVMDWRKLARSSDILLWRDSISVLFRGGLNVNTAPAGVLRAAPDLSSADTARLIAERELEPIGADVRVPGLVLDPFRFQHLPGNVIRLTFAGPSEHRTLRYHIRMTPQADRQRPWQVELSYPVATQTTPSALESNPLRSIPHPLFATSQ